MSASSEPQVKREAVGGNAIGRFGRWLLSPSWTMLTVAGLLVGAYLAVVFLGGNDSAFRLQQALTGGDEYSTDQLDLYNQVERLKRFAEAEPATSVVAVVGGSTTRESLLSEIALEERIFAEGAPRTRVFDMASSGQDLIVTWTLAEVAACSGADIVVVGLNQNRIRSMGTNHPLPLTGYWEQDVRGFVEAGLYQPRFGGLASSLVAEGRARSLMLLEVADAILSDRPTAVEKGQRTTGTHLYMHRPADPQRPIGLLGNIERSLAERPLPGPEVVTRIRDSVARCGARMVVLLNAINPIGLDPETFPLLAKAQVDIREMISQAGFGSEVVIDLQSPEVALEPIDFFDWGHLHLREAMERTTAAIGSRLAPLLKETSP